MQINNTTLNASQGNVSLVSQEGAGALMNISRSNITAVNFLLDNGKGGKGFDTTNRAVVLQNNTTVNVTGNATFNAAGSGRLAITALGLRVSAGNITINSSGASQTLQSGTNLTATGSIMQNGVNSQSDQAAVGFWGKVLT